MPTIADFKFDQWVRIAKERIETLPQRVIGEIDAQVTAAPPISAGAIDILASQLTRPIPTCLRAFLEHGSGGLEFSYKWTPAEHQAALFESIFDGLDTVWGHGEFYKASAFAEWLADCKSWAEGTWVSGYPEDFEFWTQSFPILAMKNADFLAVDQRSNSDDPPVVYLSHDDESKRIAPSFTAFLQEWERLYYVGPESWMIELFLDVEGFLSSKTEAAKIFKSAIGDVA